MSSKEKKDQRKHSDDEDEDYSVEMIEMSPSLANIMNEVSQKLHGYKQMTPTSSRNLATTSRVRFAPEESREEIDPNRPRTSRTLTPTRYRFKPEPILKSESAPTLADNSQEIRHRISHSSLSSETTSEWDEEELMKAERAPNRKVVPQNVRRVVSEDNEQMSPSYKAEGDTHVDLMLEELVEDSDEKFRESSEYILDQQKNGKKYAFWYTSEMYRNTDREQFIYLSIQEFIIYILFLISVSFVVLGSFTVIMYYYSIVLSDIFTRTKFKTTQGLAITYKDVRTIQQYWANLLRSNPQLITVPTLVWHLFVTNAIFLMKYLYKKYKIPMYLDNAFLSSVFFKYFEDRLAGNTLTMEESKLILLQNILVGIPRLRQVRVRPDSCKVPQDFAATFRSCFGYYRSGTEDREPFRIKIGSEWTYSDRLAEEYNGKISTYGTGGFYVNLTRNYEFSRTIIQNLRQNLWIDHGTRAVFVDFTLYNPNVNLFCVVKLVAEFPPSGGVVPSGNFYALKLIRYVSIWDHIVLAFEVATVVMLILYTVEELREIFVMGLNYLLNLWSILDLMIVIVGWILFIIGYIRYYRVNDRLPLLVNTINKDDHANFDSLADIQLLFNSVSAFFLTLVWIKLIKFMMLVKVMYHIFKTIGKCAQELLGLTFILFVLIISFALLGHILFGAQVEEFGTLGKSMISLMILLVGALDYRKVHETRPFLGPLYFIFYIYTFILVFLSLFVAVFVNGYTTVRFDIMEDRFKIYFKNIFYDFLKGCLKFVGFPTLAATLSEKQRRDATEENYMILVDILRRSGFRGKELTLFLKKHDIKKGNEITTEKMAEIYEDIDGKGQIYIEALEHEQIMNDIDLLRLRMAYSDKMTEELASKIDCLCSKISP